MASMSTENIKEMWSSISLLSYNEIRRGTAQGSPVSPTVFALCINEVFTDIAKKAGCEFKAYADDGIFHGIIKDINLIINGIDEATGLEWNLNKCSYVKKDGLWVAPLIFLGFKYEVISIFESHITDTGSYCGVTERDNLYGNTRKGSNLLFNKELLLDLRNEILNGVQPVRISKLSRSLNL